VLGDRVGSGICQLGAEGQRCYAIHVRGVSQNIPGLGEYAATLKVWCSFLSNGDSVVVSRPMVLVDVPAIVDDPATLGLLALHQPHGVFSTEYRCGDVDVHHRHELID
jgi:hypothetical protein